jgi:ribosomal protein S18 acetylase RimI-like enzyme
MIRRAIKEDIQRIIELLHQVDMVHHVLRPDLFKPYTTKYDEQELEALLGDDDKPIFVFVDEGKPIFDFDEGQAPAAPSSEAERTSGSGSTVLGYAFCQITEVRNHHLLEDVKTLYIDDICVDENARGKHVGKALYEYVRDYAKTIGCNNITLNVWEGNEPALHFYRNMGMQVQKTTMEVILK